MGRRCMRVSTKLAAILLFPIPNGDPSEKTRRLLILCNVFHIS
jgi:hypothetical protein